QREERMITALARTDFLLRDREGRVPMGPALFVALNSALPEMGPSQRVSLIEKLANVAAYYPEPTLMLLRRLRLEPAADEIVDSCLGPRKYSQSDVLLELGHAHHQVARGILTADQSVAVIKELYALVVEEQRV